MSDELTTGQLPATEPVVAAQPALAAGGEDVTPTLSQIIVVALIAIVFTAVWLGIYEFLDRVIWESPFVAQNRWTLPALVLFFSLIVGLAQKYLHAPNVIHGGAVESLTGEEAQISTRIPFVGTLVSSYASLLSGASVGPEGALAFLVLQISTWFHRRIRASKKTMPGFAMAALASAYNGLVGSPLFSGVLATELRVGGVGDNAIVFVVWNLLAGVIGYLFFTLLGLPTFAKELALPPVDDLTLLYVIIAFLLGILGALVAVTISLLFNAFEIGLARIFKDQVIWRILAAGVVISIVGYFVPEVLFAGETQIFPMIDNPAQYGVLMLIGLGLLKLIMLGLSFKSGYMGGPIFPILFASTMFGLALSLLFPTVPVSIFVLCTEAAVVTLALRAPLTAILLVSVVGTATPNEIALLVLSAVTSMVLGVVLMRLRAKRAAARELAA